MDKEPSQEKSNNQHSAEQPSQIRKPTSNRFFEKEYFDSLHEDVVKDILREILIKSGNEKALERFIPFKEIITYQNANEDIAGTYYPDKHKIKFNKAHFAEDSKEITRSMTLAVLIHEELHAVTNQNFAIKDGDLEGKRQTGFQTATVDVVTGQSIEKTWRKFNEGITELIKDDILLEYVKRTGDRKDFMLEGFDTNLEKSTYQTYLDERVLVNEIFIRVGIILGISLDAVREAFVHAYFSGIGIDDIQDSLYGIGGDVLLKKMGDVSNEELRSNFKNGIEKYVQSSMNNKDEIMKYAQEYIAIMSANYLKRGLAG